MSQFHEEEVCTQTVENLRKFFMPAPYIKICIKGELTIFSLDVHSKRNSTPTSTQPMSA